MISPASNFQPHEIKLQERRNEETSEARRLHRLKLKLQAMRKPELEFRRQELARAS